MPTDPPPPPRHPTGRADAPADPLRGLPPPPPMPPDLVERIITRLHAAAPEPAPRRRNTARRTLTIAATCAVAATLGTATWLGLRRVADTTPPADPAAAHVAHPAADTPTGPAPEVRISTTAYHRDDLAAKAGAVWRAAPAPPAPLAAGAVALGPIATPLGAIACLTAVRTGPAPASSAAPAGPAAPAAPGDPAPTSGSTVPPAAGRAVVDVAFFEGRPAAVIVVATAGGLRAWAVPRSCGAGGAGDTPLVGPVGVR